MDNNELLDSVDTNSNQLDVLLLNLGVMNSSVSFDSSTSTISNLPFGAIEFPSSKLTQEGEVWCLTLILEEVDIKKLFPNQPKMRWGDYLGLRDQDSFINDSIWTNVTITVDSLPFKDSRIKDHDLRDVGNSSNQVKNQMYGGKIKATVRFPNLISDKQSRVTSIQSTITAEALNRFCEFEGIFVFTEQASSITQPIARLLLDAVPTPYDFTQGQNEDLNQTANAIMSHLGLRITSFEPSALQGDDKSAYMSALKGLIHLPFKGKNIEISTPILQGDYSWPLYFDFWQTKPNLNDVTHLLEHFAGEAGLDGVYIPPQVDFLDQIYLGDMTVVVLPPRGSKLPSIDSIRLTVATDFVWVTPIPKVSISNIGMATEVHLQGAGKSGDISYTVFGGQIVIGNISAQESEQLIFKIGARYPEWQFSGELLDTSPDQKGVALSQVAKALGFDAPSDIVNFKVVVMRAAFDLDQHLFAAAARIAAPEGKSGTTKWEVSIAGVVFGLEELGLSYSTAPNQTEVSIDAVLYVSPNIKVDSAPRFNVMATYQGNQWIFSCELEGELNVGELARGLFNLSDLPDWATRFKLNDVSLTMATGNKAIEAKDGKKAIPERKSGYIAQGTFTWELHALDELVKLEAKMFIAKRTGDANAVKQFWGQFTIHDFVVIVSADISGEKNQSPNYKFAIQYKKAKLNAKVVTKFDDKNQTYSVLSVQLTGITLGEILTYLVELASPNEDFKLDSPWDTLNAIDLSNAKLIIDKKHGKVSVDIDVQKNLGFASVENVGVEYVKIGLKSKVNFIFKGKILAQSYNDANPLKWDVVNDPAPVVAGTGSKFLELRYLGIGRHVEVNGLQNAVNVASGLTAIREAINSTSIVANDDNDKPITNISNHIKFNATNNWLIGLDFSLMGFLSLSAIVYDPKLYGIHIGFNGSKAGSLAGLDFELMYHQVTNDIGVFNGTLVLPEKYRRLDFGAVAVTLGPIAVDVYTNGDFKINLGFPENNNFSKSYALQLGIFEGSGGLYFAKLSGATSKTVPVITNGTFTPVLEFGVGLKLGHHKDFSQSVLSASMFIGIEALLEGTLAWFHPENQTIPPDKYYRVVGTAGIVVDLRGSLNLLICIEASLHAEAYATIVLESYKATTISFSASVEAHGKIKTWIKDIHFSYSFTIREQFRLGSDSATPWLIETSSKESYDLLSLPSQMNKSHELFPWSLEMPGLLTSVEKKKIVLQLGLIPLQKATFTLLEGQTISQDFADSNAIVMMSIEGCQIDSNSNIQPTVEQLSLNQLVEGLLRRVTANILDRNTNCVSLADINRLGQAFKVDGVVAPAGFERESLEHFLTQNFCFEIVVPTKGSSEKNPNSTVFTAAFPMLPAIQLTGFDQFSRDFSNYNLVDQAYITDLKELMNRPSLDIDEVEENGCVKESLAWFVFRESMQLITRMALDEASKLASEWVYSTGTNEYSLTEISRKFSYRVSYIVEKPISITQLAQYFSISEESLVYFNPDIEKQLQEVFSGECIDLYIGISPTSIAYSNLETHLHEGICIKVGKTEIFVESRQSLASISKLLGISDFELCKQVIDIPLLFGNNVDLILHQVPCINLDTLISQLNKVAMPNIGGMLSRSLLQGMRVADPKAKSAPSISLYEALGQQIELKKESKIHVDIDSDWGSLNHQELSLFMPSSSLINIKIDNNLEQAPSHKLVSRIYNLTQKQIWQTNPDHSFLQNSKTIFKLPQALLTKLNSSDASLDYKLSACSIISSKKNHFLNYTAATQITFSIRLLEEAHSAEITNNKFVYELIGADTVDRKILYQLLANRLQGNVDLLYMNSIVGKSTSQYISNDLKKEQTYILKTNLSTETVSQSLENSSNLLIGSADEGIGEHYALIEHFYEYLHLLWQGSVVGGSGYVFGYQTINDCGLPQSIFDAKGVAELTLMFMHNEQNKILPIHNCLVINDIIDENISHLMLRSDQDQTVTSVLAPGVVGVQYKQENPSTSLFIEETKRAALEHYSILGCCLEGTDNSIIISPQTNRPQAFNNLTTTKHGHGVDNWHYYRTLPVNKTTSLESFYEYVGKVKKLSWWFQDLFGNKSNIISELELKANYTDTLLPIHQWPMVNTTYSFTEGKISSGVDSSVCLSVLLTLTSDLILTSSRSLTSVLSSAIQYQKTYTTIYKQLVDRNITIDLKTSLFNSINKADVKSNIISFVNDVRNYLNNFIDQEGNQRIDSVRAVAEDGDKLIDILVRYGYCAQQATLAHELKSYSWGINLFAITNIDNILSDMFVFESNYISIPRFKVIKPCQTLEDVFNDLPNVISLDHILSSSENNNISLRKGSQIVRRFKLSKDMNNKSMLEVARHLNTTVDQIAYLNKSVKNIIRVHTPFQYHEIEARVGVSGFETVSMEMMFEGIKDVIQDKNTHELDFYDWIIKHQNMECIFNEDIELLYPYILQANDSISDSLLLRDIIDLNLKTPDVFETGSLVYVGSFDEVIIVGATLKQSALKYNLTIQQLMNLLVDFKVMSNKIIVPNALKFIDPNDECNVKDYLLPNVLDPNFVFLNSSTHGLVQGSQTIPLTINKISHNITIMKDDTFNSIIERVNAVFGISNFDLDCFLRLLGGKIKLKKLAYHFKGLSQDYFLTKNMLLTQLNKAAIFEISVELEISRSEEYVDFPFKDSDIHRVISDIPSEFLKFDSSNVKNIQEFTNNIEKLIKSIKVATGRVYKEGLVCQNLWAIASNILTVRSKGITRFYVIPPLSNKLEENLSLLVRADFTLFPEKLIPKNNIFYHRVDIEHWMNRFLGDMDHFLCLDNISYLFQDESIREVVDKLISIKEKLALYLAERVTQLYPIGSDSSTSVSNADQLLASKKMVYQKFLKNLSIGYDASIFVQWDIETEQQYPEQMKLIGRVKDSLNQHNSDWIRSTSKIDTVRNSKFLTIEIPNSVSVKNDVISINPQLELKEIEFNIQSESISQDVDFNSLKESYVSSDWLQLVNPTLSSLGSEIQVPLPLRLAPTQAKLISHTASCNLGPQEIEVNNSNLKDLFSWNYNLQVAYLNIPQDTVNIHINFDNSESSSGYVPSQWQELAKYISVADKFWEISNLNRVDKLSEEQKEYIHWFCSQAEKISSILKNDLESNQVGLISYLPSMINLQCRIYNDTNTRQILTVDVSGLPANVKINIVVKWLSLNRKEDRSVQNIALEYQISKNGIYSVPVTNNIPEYAEIVYDISCDDLNLLNYIRATASVSIDRNKHLLSSDQKNKNFIYKTEMISFPKPIFPNIHHKDKISTYKSLTNENFINLINSFCLNSSDLYLSILFNCQTSLGDVIPVLLIPNTQINQINTTKIINDLSNWTADYVISPEWKWQLTIKVSRKQDHGFVSIMQLDQLIYDIAM